MNSNTNFNECNLYKSFNKSLRENSQLIFSKKLTISVNNNSSNQSFYPNVELADIFELIESESISNSSIKNNFYISCLFDNRTIFSKELANNSNSVLSIYFPLSREKYIMYCEYYLVNNIGGNINNKKLDMDYNELLEKYWGKLTQEEKLLFESVDKDSIQNTKSNEDLTKYIAQEQLIYSKNFSICLFFPLKCEYTIYPMPQVIANTRKQKFESLLKPHKMPQKFYMEYNSKESSWNTNLLNN